MNLNDVEKIIQMFEKSNVNSIDLEIDNIKIYLKEKKSQKKKLFGFLNN